MDTKIPVLFVIAIAVAGTMWGMSGITETLQTNPGENLDSPDQLEDQANDSAVNEDGEFSGPVNPGDESNIIGLIISGGRAIADIFALVILLPFELHSLGFPRWFSYPIGLAIQTFASIGIIQFITGRVFR